jgi:hypothetical protein
LCEELTKEQHDEFVVRYYAAKKKYGEHFTNSFQFKLWDSQLQALTSTGIILIISMMSIIIGLL